MRGAENIPAEGGALVVSNHSGTVPVDGLMTAVSIHDHTGRYLRPLGADLVFRLPIVGDLARKGGATLACNEDAERMLRGGELVGVWPEGFKGIGKPFSERYKLQRFGRGGFVSAAIRTGVPIIPTSVVGAEEIYPLVGNIPSLARLLGMPYLPITPLFPLLGPLGLIPLPSKWLIEFGEPIRTDDYDERRGRRPDAGLQRDRPGARVDPADALLAADEAVVGLLLTRLSRAPDVRSGPLAAGRARADGRQVRSGSSRWRSSTALPSFLTAVAERLGQRSRRRAAGGLVEGAGRRRATEVLDRGTARDGGQQLAVGRSTVLASGSPGSPDVARRSPWSWCRRRCRWQRRERRRPGPRPA